MCNDDDQSKMDTSPSGIGENSESKDGDQNDDIDQQSSTGRFCNRYITISTSIHLLCIKYFYLIGTYQFGDDDTSVGNADDQWPTMQDLNTRLRRVITSYQRNYKREELKMQQKAKVFIFMQLKFYKNSMFCLSILME